MFQPATQRLVKGMRLSYLVLIVIGGPEERFREYVDEFGQMLEVLRHLGGQHHVDDTLPDDFVTFPIHTWSQQ